MQSTTRTKPVSKISFRSWDRSRVERACIAAINVSQSFLQIAKELLGETGIPGLSTGVSGLLFVLGVVKKTYENAQDIEKLTININDLIAVLQKSRNGKAPTIAMRSRIDTLSTTWCTAADEIRKIASHRVFMRLIYYSDIAVAITGYIQTLTWSIQNFTVETLLAIEFALDEHVHFMKNAATRIEEKIDSGFQRVVARLDAKDGGLPRAIFAQFDNKIRHLCLDGTRTDVLAEIYRWIDAGSMQVANDIAHDQDPGSSATTIPDGGPPLIFWINGSAGTGKTTIASTVAETCKVQEILGASFFCSRDDAECSNPNLIFTTIAHQLGQFYAPFRTEIIRALTSKPDIVYASVPYQLEELIVKPLRLSRSTFPSCVVVIDALDECQDSGTTSIVLSSLSRHATELQPLKIFITSRPEPQVTSVFKSSKLKPATQRLILHAIELEVVQQDIELYLAAALQQIANYYSLDNSWPSRKDIISLAVLSFGLFIFAATATRYIEDQNYCNPKHQLAALLSNTAGVAEKSSPHHHLDQLYTQVLLRAFPEVSSHLSGRLKLIIGTIILIRDRLTPSALEHLLGLETSYVRMTLACLHSVIIVPEEEDDVGVIRLLHPSFFDFMTNSERCLDPRFLVDAGTQHTMLARSCLNALLGLRRDMCGIGNMFLFNSEVGDLPHRISLSIPLQVRYACRHWAFHLQNAMISDVILNSMKKFCSKYLLFWVGICSLLGELRGAILSLVVARRALADSSKNIPDVMTMLQEGERFMLEFFSLLSVSSLQVYGSALLFTPKQTLLHQTYSHDIMLPTRVSNATEERWNPCIRTMDGHSSVIQAVAFSPDGMRIVSGSVDRTVRLWDAVSGAHLHTLEGHSASVQSVTFSSDGKHIISGSDDATIRVWETVDGAHLHTLEGHFGTVQSISVSSVGGYIVSGSNDETIRLWDAASGAHLHTLQGHSSGVMSVASSPDGTRIVSGSRDKTLRLWDAVTGAPLRVLEGHSGGVESVAFSPDGMRIVSSSDDKTLRLWDAISGSHLRTLKGHLARVPSAAYSPDGMRIVSVCRDKTIRLWDPVSGTHLHTLEGHSQWIETVAFSPDSTRIVSGSYDNTLRLWDALNGSHFRAVERHSARVESVAFCPSGTRIVSVSDDKTLRLWDINGAHLHTLKGHSGTVLSVAFSCDSKYIVSGSYDNSLRLWSAINGAHLHTFIGHAGTVQSVSFSPDGTHIISGSSDSTLRLWETTSGACLHILEGHEETVESVAFSPDGTRIVSGSADRTLRLWEALSGAHLQTLTGHSALVHLVAFSHDGTCIASGSIDNTLRLWDTVQGTHMHTLEGHSDAVQSMAFSPDSMRVVSGSPDGTLRVWDVISGALLCILQGHHDSVQSVARSPRLIRSPLSSRDDNLTSTDLGLVVDGEWIVSATHNRRLCWIPVSCRPRCLASRDMRVVMGTADGRVVFLDFTGMDVYLKEI